METIGTLAGGIAHDFNNILSPISGYTEMLLMETRKEDPQYAHLNTILDCVGQARELVSQMLTFSRQKEPSLKVLSLSKVVEAALILVRSSLPGSLKLDVRLEDSQAFIMADMIQIQQVVMSLVTYGYPAIGDKNGTLSIHLSTLDIPETFFNLTDRNYACLTIKNDAHSMDQDTCDRIFDPYFNAGHKEPESGIGLSVAHGIVHGHGGQIRVESSREKGSRFDICFPLIDPNRVDSKREMDMGKETEKRANEPPYSGSIRRGTEKILLVDDDKKIIDMLGFMFEKLGYKIRCYTDGSDAVDYFKTHADDFDLVITDLTMPCMSGLELVDRINHIRPDIPIVVCSGVEETLRGETEKFKPVKGFLKKPISVKSLSRVLARILD